MADTTDVKTQNPNKKPKIRPVSRDTVSIYGRFKSARCFAEIDRRIRLGVTLDELVKAVQEEFKELTDTTPKYLKKLIKRYRRSIPAVELIGADNAALARTVAKKISNTLDELAELEKLYSIQANRIDIDYRNETNIQKLLPQTGNEIFIAAKLLKQSVDLKMDLGLIKKQLGTLELTGQLAADIGNRYGQDSIGKVVSDPDSRRKVLGLAEKIMALTAKSGDDAMDILAGGKEIIEAISTESRSAPTMDTGESTDI